MKPMKTTLNIITFNSVIIDKIDQLSFNAEQYTSIFKDIHNCRELSRVYISHKKESSKTISKLNHENGRNMVNIFYILVKNDNCLSHNEFRSHKEHSISS